MDKAKEALWTKSFVLDTLINFLVFLIYYLLIVIIAVVGRAVYQYSRVSQDALFRAIDLLDFDGYVFLHT